MFSWFFFKFHKVKHNSELHIHSPPASSHSMTSV